MGYDVYTPAYNRMTESAEYQQVEAFREELFSRPTFDSQDWTEKDQKDFSEYQERLGKLEDAVGHFRWNLPFKSEIHAIQEFDNGDYHFALTHEEVGRLLEEYRRYLRDQVFQSKHLEEWVNGFGDRVLSPFEIAVQKYKLLCTVFRLGEGMCVA